MSWSPAEQLAAMPGGFSGERLVVAVSGGKDSTAMCLWLQRHGYAPGDYDRVFCDTGWELPEVYAYLRGPLTDVVGPIVELQPVVPTLNPDREALALAFEQRLGHRSAMVRLILHKGMFPSRKIRFCTRALKIKPAAAWLKAQPYEVINVLGIRAEESASRARMTRWEWSDAHDCYVWRPLLSWTFKDVAAIHRDFGLRPAAPYFAGATRVGCAPCIMARKAEIAWLAAQYPERIKILADLEATVGEISGRPEGRKPTWFHNPNPPRCRRTRRVLTETPGYHSMWPIGRVVKWATLRGGTQAELFAGSVEDHGCMRWGFCDTGGPSW